MQMVIEINELVYEGCLILNRANEGTVVEKAVANGTPLPKGHGRLIDADKLEEDITNALKNGLSPYEAKVFVEFMCYVDEAPTVIKATKESKE